MSGKQNLGDSVRALVGSSVAIVDGAAGLVLDGGTGVLAAVCAPVVGGAGPPAAVVSSSAPVAVAVVVAVAMVVVVAGAVAVAVNTVELVRQPDCSWQSSGHKIVIPDCVNGFSHNSGPKGATPHFGS